MRLPTKPRVFLKPSLSLLMLSGAGLVDFAAGPPPGFRDQPSGRLSRFKVSTLKVAAAAAKGAFDAFVWKRRSVGQATLEDHYRKRKRSAPVPIVVVEDGAKRRRVVVPSTVVRRAIGLGARPSRTKRRGRRGPSRPRRRRRSGRRVSRRRTGPRQVRRF